MERSIPASPESEEAVLGSILIDPDAMVGLAAVLTVEDFYREKNGWIYEAMLELHAKHEPVDYVTLCERLEAGPHWLDTGGYAYVSSLINAVPTAVHALYYANIVIDRSTKRRSISVANQIVRCAYDDIPAEEVVDQAQSLVFGLGSDRTQKPYHNAPELLHTVIDRIEYLRSHPGEMLGVPTGYSFLDKVVQGFQKSEFWIIAARPSVGKTAFMLNMALRQAKKHKKRVGFFSLEMPADSLMFRLLAIESGIENIRLRSGNVTEEEMYAVMEAANELNDYPLWIDDTPNISDMQLHSRARQMTAEHGLDIIYVDYIGLMDCTKDFGGNRVQEVSHVSKSLKALSGELALPIVVASQLSRAPMARENKRAILSDLRDSGSLEQDADGVILLYREDFLDPSKAETAASTNTAEANVAKHRNGPTDTVPLYYDKTLTKFEDLELTRTPL